GREEGVEPERLDNLWQKEAQAVIGRDRAEIDEAEADHARIEQNLGHRINPHRLALATFDQQPVTEPFPLVARQPGCILRAVRQVEEHDDCENNGRYGLDEKQPLPARKAEAAVQIEQES